MYKFTLIFIIFLIVHPYIAFMFNGRRKVINNYNILDKDIDKIILEINQYIVYQGHTNIFITELFKKASTLQENLRLLNQKSYLPSVIKYNNLKITEIKDGLMEVNKSLTELKNKEKKIYKHLTDLKIKLMKNESAKDSILLNKLNEMIKLDIIEAEMIMMNYR